MSEDWKGEHLISARGKSDPGGGLFSVKNMRAKGKSSVNTKKAEKRAERRASVKRLADLGISVAQIASALDMRQDLVSKDMVAMGIPVPVDERERAKG